MIFSTVASEQHPRGRWISGFSLLVLSCAVLVALGCGGKSSSSTQAAPPAVPADFSLSASPATVALTGGAGSQQISVSVTGANGFASAVAVALTGLPAGVTAQPATLSLTPGQAQTITLSAAASVAAGTSALVLTGSSGALSHTAKVALSIAAAAAPGSYFLGFQPASISIIPGDPAIFGPKVKVGAGTLNGFNNPVSVAISGLPAGVTATPSIFSLTPLGAPQTVGLVAAGNTAPGTYTVTATGQSGALTQTAALALTVAAPLGHDVVTYHDDNARTGWNASETLLTTANVNASTFGKLRLLGVDGKVDAEPLYLSAVSLNGQVHNVLYVVTEHDSVYAFDADTGTQLWKSTALAASEVPSEAVRGCGQISPEIGITATPVIDRSRGPNGAMFFVAMSKDAGGAYHQRLHALDVSSGAELAGSPTEITGTYPGTGDNSIAGNVVFDPKQYAERAGLLLQNGTIYLGWTSHCDIRPYTGWVMGYNELSLAQTAILNLTPNGSEGSIWMSGAGLAGDAAGNVYFLDANGTLDASLNAAGFPAMGDYGNAIMKLGTANGGLGVADYFEPYNSIAESNADLDLGSGGALLLPDLTDAGGTVRHLVVGAGKDGNIYVADRDNMGKYNPADNSRLYQELRAALVSGAWSMPAYFNNTVYFGGQGDFLKAFPISNAKLAATPASRSAIVFSYPGTTPGVSSNGTSNGIVWAVESGTGGPAVLHAYDATDLGKELYSSVQATGGRDGFGNGNKFITPLIINGKVYVGTPTGVAVFGLLAGH